jgi:hypothetical protein
VAVFVSAGSGDIAFEVGTSVTANLYRDNSATGLITSTGHWIEDLPAIKRQNIASATTATGLRITVNTFTVSTAGYNPRISVAGLLYQTQ